MSLFNIGDRVVDTMGELGTVIGVWTDVQTRNVILKVSLDECCWHTNYLSKNLKKYRVPKCACKVCLRSKCREHAPVV